MCVFKENIFPILTICNTDVIKQTVSSLLLFTLENLIYVVDIINKLLIRKHTDLVSAEYVGKF